MLADELLAETDVAIGEIGFADRRGGLTQTGLAEMRTIGRAIDGDFTLFAATLRANFAAHAGTMPARAPLFA